jgi:hypothetical protein
MKRILLLFPALMLSISALWALSVYEKIVDDFVFNSNNIITAYVGDTNAEKIIIPEKTKIKAAVEKIVSESSVEARTPFKYYLENVIDENNEWIYNSADENRRVVTSFNR